MLADIPSLVVAALHWLARWLLTPASCGVWSDVTWPDQAEIVAIIYWGNGFWAWGRSYSKCLTIQRQALKSCHSLWGIAFVKWFLIGRKFCYWYAFHLQADCWLKLVNISNIVSENSIKEWSAATSIEYCLPTTLQGAVVETAVRPSN